MRVLRWTSNSLRHLSEALHGQGHWVCPHVIADCLRELGYSLQANRKTREGSSPMDRDAQFHYINDQAKAFLAANEPVISVDAKKKESVGNFADNKGRVSVGTDHDTANFAVHAIHRWWLAMGQKRYPKASRLMITADRGGSNGHRPRLWKIELQRLANELRIPITVCHLPPRTSKWNKLNTACFPLLRSIGAESRCAAFRTIVQLIAATTTTTGLTMRAELDENKYPKGMKISDAKLAAIKLVRHAFHGDWNYTISPNDLKPYLCTMPNR
jgi:hypothetical protein